MGKPWLSLFLQLQAMSRFCAGDQLATTFCIFHTEPTMKKAILPLLLTAACFLFALHPGANGQTEPTANKKLRILLVAGGCCHDYATQTQLLKDGIEARLNATVDVAYNEDKTTKATFPIYESDDWAKDFDLVIHDECSADVTDPVYVNRILKAHRDGKPAVNLHCGMHSYRWDNFREPVKIGDSNAGWYEMIGIQSTGHGPQSPIDISYTDKTHPITVGLADWTTINEELYNNIQIFPTAKALANGRQMQLPKQAKGKAKDPNAKAQEVTAVVAWTNEFGPNKTRIFSTTIGHNNDTVGDARYLDLVSQGIRWAVGESAK
jgi:type 1 glutamine amidotransferase